MNVISLLKQTKIIGATSAPKTYEVVIDGVAKLFQDKVSQLKSTIGVRILIEPDIATVLKSICIIGSKEEVDKSSLSKDSKMYKIIVSLRQLVDEFTSAADTEDKRLLKT